jgi:hypothetical protein
VRALAMVIGLLAALGGSYAAFGAMRAVGPDDRTDEFGFGDAAVISPGGGDLFQSRNFALVIAALERELGKDGALSYLRVERSQASATARVGDIDRTIEIDASGRSRSRGGGKADLGARMPVSKLQAGAIDKLVRESQRESRALVESLTLQSNTREWTVDMEDGGEPDSFVGNLDGAGLRLSGEPSPEPIGASPDSLLRAENLAEVVAAARKEAPADARVLGVDIRPDRVGIELETGGRELSLNYGYDAQLTSRSLRAKTGVDSGSIGWDDIDPAAPERMIRAAGKLLGEKLAGVQYVLLSLSPFPGRKAYLTMYFPSGHDPAYGVADLHGRRFTWPGRGD